MTERRRSWWGWGWEDEALPDDQVAGLADMASSRAGADIAPRRPPDPSDLQLRAPRLTPPDKLAHLCTTTPYDRAAHSLGKAYRDVVRALRGEVENPPDVVAFPTDEHDVVALLDWCSDAGVAAIPYGGGSSVVGGVEPDVGDGYRGVVSIDLTQLDQVLEIDPVSRAARIQAGVLGPHLEDQLRPHGYTLRHFPQSFEFSSLGGWLATRSGGHYASVYTHIDDLVESIRAVTPAGAIESRRLPGSGAGPSPDRMLLGSEGALGIITEAWMRLQDRPVYRASAAVHFGDFLAGAGAVRALSQSALFPTNCRLLDAGEARGAGVDDGSSLLVLGFESADHPVTAWMDRAVELAQDHGGEVPAGVRYSGPDERAGGASANEEGAVGAWRSSFMRAAYGRDAMARVAGIADTFETACTWSAFEELHGNVVAEVQRAVTDICGGGRVSCRFTHVYPDGPAPYFTVGAQGRPGAELEMWDAIKAAASEAVLRHGGTITHHHAVGRDHMPWYVRQRPELFGTALAAAKSALDPAGIMNPGVVVPLPIRT
jgi:alkyldihydroxyacetonephosphate synthase